MKCLYCEDFQRVVVEDDSLASGFFLAPCPECCCRECERSLLDGICIYGCALQRRFSGEAVWRAAGDAMHERALWVSATIAERNSYRARRAFCDRMALQSRLRQQRALDLYAKFDHVFETRSGQ